jgi:hypothetical protein
MRCPHCAGEIPAGSRFCGICGRSIALAADGLQAPEDPGRWAGSHPGGAPGESHVDSVSLFELPPSRAGRRAKLALLLVLDAVLAGAGIVMLLSYLESRRDARRAPAAARRGAERGEVEVLSPTRVTVPRPAAPSHAAPSPAPGAASNGEDEGEGAEAAGDGEAPAPRARPEQKPRSKPAVKPRSKPTSGSGSQSKSGSSRGPRAGGDTAAAMAEAEDGAAGAEAEDSGEPEAGEPDEGAGDRAAGEEEEPVDREGEDEEGEIERITARLRRVVDGHQLELERCYAAADPGSSAEPLEGRIDIRFVLMPDGSAAEVNPSGNTTGSTVLADCVADLIRGWSFPGGASDRLELEWPFVFRRPAEAPEE